MTAEHHPRLHDGVAVLSAFVGLGEHRAAIIRALTAHGLMPDVMEHDSARGCDVIQASLERVARGAACILIIGHRYGSSPNDAIRNPNNLSLTELEFEEAQRLGRPILLFLMGENYPMKPGESDVDPVNQDKLKSFRERAKRMYGEGSVERVYYCFDSLEAFKEKANQAIAELRRELDATRATTVGTENRALSTASRPESSGTHGSRPTAPSHAWRKPLSQGQTSPAESPPANARSLPGSIARAMRDWHAFLLSAALVLIVWFLFDARHGVSYAVELLHRHVDWVQLLIISCVIGRTYLKPWPAQGGPANTLVPVARSLRVVWLWWWLIYANHSLEHVVGAFASVPAGATWARVLRICNPALFAAVVTCFISFAQALLKGRRPALLLPALVCVGIAGFLTLMESAVPAAVSCQIRTLLVAATSVAAVVGAVMLAGAMAATGMIPERTRFVLVALYGAAQMIYAWSGTLADGKAYLLATAAKLTFLWFKLSFFMQIEAYLERPGAHLKGPAVGLTVPAQP